MRKPVKRRKRKKIIGIVRELDPSDPRSLAHPSHREQWLELARALGRAAAREEIERLRKKPKK
jgi:hypothetical protein